MVDKQVSGLTPRKVMGKVALIAILILVTVLPSLKMFSHIYYILTSFILIILACICILMLNTHLAVRIALVLVILAIFQSNIRISYGVLSNVFLARQIIPARIRKDDYTLRQQVYQIFNKNFKLDLNIDLLPRNKPTIIVANYCKDRVENIACILLPVNMAIMMRTGLAILGLDKMIKWPLFTEASGSYETTRNLICGHVLQGRSVFGYVTPGKSLFLPNQIIRVRSGLFSIAKELSIPVTPVAFDYIDLFLGTIPRQNFRVHVGKPFMVTDVKQSVRDTAHFFRDKLTEFMETKYANM